MSREGSQHRIDSLKSTLSTSQYERTALGNAVRFSTMINVLNEGIDGQAFADRDEFLPYMENSVREIDREFNVELGTDFPGDDRSIQQARHNKAFNSRLGGTIADETIRGAAKFSDANSSPFRFGTSNAFNRFTGEILAGGGFNGGGDDEDFFGSRVLYDNVFGSFEDFEDGTSQLSKRIINIDSEDTSSSAAARILNDTVQRSLYDGQNIVDRIDLEFQRFHGDSLVNQLSMTGSGLQSARRTIRNTLAEGTAVERNKLVNAADLHASIIQDRTDQADIVNALKLIKNNLGNRSSAATEGGFVDKAGIANFVDLVNTAENHITIQSFQFQNDAISASLIDTIQRRVLEQITSGKEGNPFQVDLVLAYPRQRNLEGKVDPETRYGVGATNYNILGPNLIEALKLQEVQNQLQEALRGMGYTGANIEDYFRLNVQFRDKKFHPKVYLTDNVAGIGTQNLTGPVGNSVNQAGSNFETMRFVVNKYKDDKQLVSERLNSRHLRRDILTEQADIALKTGDITQSLLYRQIESISNEELTYSRTNVGKKGGSTATPILTQSRGMQIGFAGDIWQHLKNTLNYAHERAFKVVGGNTRGGFSKETTTGSNTHMFMVLDQAFMLQLGDTSKEIALAGEMGKEISSAYGKDTFQTRRYYEAQNKLFDLLITGKASVVVDTKNYREQVINPLIQKIDKSGSERLKSNFNKYGRNLGLMAGYSLFNPSTANDDLSYSKKMGQMISLLRAQGFTKEAGFSKSDLKQIIGMGSDNIHMAKAPRQHVKSFGLMNYDSKADPKLISYYMGSSNLGQYSLGIEGGIDKLGNAIYKKGDGNLTNTEVGLMLGDRNISNALSRATAHQSRMSKEYDQSFSNDIEFHPLNHDWSLDQEEERYELNLAMRHLVNTWSQLGNNSLTNPNYNAIKTEPLWQRNINHGGLVVLKNRLEQMRKTLGLPDTAFKIIDRYGDTSGSGLTSINVSLDLTQALGSKGYLESSSRLPKLQFELSVLNGPNRGSDLLGARTNDGDAGAFVYFVDKSKLVGNGIFANNSGSAISVIGRKNFEDNFISDIDQGRVNLQSGESAYMSGLDIVPQLFATVLGEAHSRFGEDARQKQFSNIKNVAERQNISTQFISRILTGYADTMDASTGRNISAITNIHNNIPVAKTAEGKKAYSLVTEKLIGDLSIIVFGNKKVDIGESDLYSSIHKEFYGMEGYEGLTGALRNMADEITLDGKARVMNNRVAAQLEKLALLSPTLATQMMRSTKSSGQDTLQISQFKDYQASLFDSFLQAREARVYAGQQAAYRTIMMGFAGSRDKNSVNYLSDQVPRDIDGNTIPSIRNVDMFARFTPLAYKPTTDINAILYRSIASKSTSMNKYENALDSVFFAQEARHMGTADNLRVLSSIGIGNILHANKYFSQHSDGTYATDAFGQILTDDQMEMFFRRDSNGNILNQSASEKAAQIYRQNLLKVFDGNETALQFYTGSRDKLSQLPQRIKNALGAKPFYQFSVAAQAATQSSFDGDINNTTISEVTEAYLNKNRSRILEGGDGYIGVIARGEELMQELDRKKSILGDDHIQVLELADKITSLNKVASGAFNDSHSALGAVFSGNVKSVLNQEQMNFLRSTTERTEELLGDSVSQDIKDELIRVEVLKASLDINLGKMIAGSDHMRYSMALIQLSGTYTDTFLANPLYGSVYKDKNTYVNRLVNGLSFEDDTQGVLARGMREGYLETQQTSIKGSMIGEGGYEVLQKRGDIIVQDPNTNSTVLKRKVDGQWKVIAVSDAKGNIETIRNVVDNTNFTPLGSPTLGTSESATYRRTGEQSVDYLMDAYHRAGNFSNNEYISMFHRLRSVMPGSGRRVEGTDSGALIKGVANFAGRNKFHHNINGEAGMYEMNIFQHLEQQIYGTEVGGSLKAYLNERHELGASIDQASDYTKLQDGTYGYTPLSSSLHGLYNANNFKSFFWSHGATIMRSVKKDLAGRDDHFMLSELFGPKGEADIATAKKVAGALLIHFGESFITSNNDGGAVDGGQITKIKRALVESAAAGDYGKHYQKLTAALYMQIQTEGKYLEKIDPSTGLTRQDIISNELFNKLTKKSTFSDISVGGLRGITSTMLQNVLAGNGSHSNEFLSQVRSLIDPTAKNAAKYGSINFDSQRDRQAAIITTAVDFMHQISAKGSSLNIPGDIDITNDDYKAVMLNVLGAPTDIDEDNREMLMQMIEGVSTQITAVSIFSDITFSYSKDPTGTQSVARHEGQHLITPFLGDIQQYKKGGQLDKIKHTVASLAAMTSNMKSGLSMYGTQYANQFGRRKAKNLVDANSNYLFSSFEKRKFLGFYQGGLTGAYTNDFVKMYDKVNRDLVSGLYQWNTDRDITTNIRNDIDNYVKAKFGYLSSVERTREVERIIERGGHEFAMTQLEDAERGLMAINNIHQSDPNKVVGKTNTKEYLSNMKNNSMYISLPSISFEQQYGQVVAHIDKSSTISTIIPSAEIMRNMGAQYADFVDPVVQKYKVLSSIFTPGHIANIAFEKIRAGAQSNINVVLTTDETKALQSVMQAANTMEVEIEKAVAGARMQEAFAGKVKYQGFTSTGIGSNLMPFGSAAMALSKQQELGLNTYKERSSLLRETTQNIRNLRTTKSYGQNSMERIYLEMKDDLFNNFSILTEAVKTNAARKHLTGVQDVIYQLHDIRKQGYASSAMGMTSDAQKLNVNNMLTTLQVGYNHLDSLLSVPDLQANQSDIKNMQMYLVDTQAELKKFAEFELGQTDFNTIGPITEMINKEVLLKYYDSHKSHSKNDFLNGFVFNDNDKEDVNSIKNFYRRQAAAIRDGIDKSRLHEFRSMKSESLNLSEKIKLYENPRALNEDQRRNGLRELYSHIKNLRDTVKDQQTYIDEKGVRKDRLDPANAYIYHASVLNYDALLSRIELAEVRVSGEHISSDKVSYLQRKVARFQEVEMILNEGNIFAGLGKSVTELSEHTLFSGNTKANGVQDYEDPTSRVIKAIKEVGEAFEGKSTLKQSAQRKFATQQLDDTIKMYQDRLSNLTKFSNTRESQSKLKNNDGSTSIKTDAEMERRISAAHLEYENRTKTLIQRLENIKLNISSKNMKLHEYKDIFTDVRLEMEDNDRGNLELAEVFRSPTPGGTDLRAHTYRLMEGVYALNRVAELSSELQLEKTGIESTKMTSDVTRGITGSWMASLGIVTYGGGDWDGDPYTTILMKVSDMQNEQQKQRMKFQQKRIVLNAYNSQLNEIIKVDSNADVSHLKSKIKKATYDATNAENKFIEAKSIIEEQSAVGQRLLTERMRKQISNYLGMDERFFVKQGEAVIDPITGKQKTYVDKNGITQLATGLGGRTMGADELNALMGQGTDIIEGLHAKAGQMMTTNIAMEALLGIKDNDPNEAIEFLTKMSVKSKTHSAKGESVSHPGVSELRERINSRLEILQRNVDAGQESYRPQLDFITALASEGKDSTVLKAYAGALSDFNSDSDRYRKYSSMMKDTAMDDTKRVAGQKAFLHRWIGSEIFNKTQEADTLSKFVGQAVGMDMTEPIFDIVLKTLGKAGGEILGKTYNTIIGSTFQDASTISTGRAIMDENSSIYNAISRHYFQDESNFDMKRLSSDDQSRVLAHMNNGGFNSEAQAAKDLYRGEFNEYMLTTQKAVKQAEGTQGFMKNIHQLLRDSIKLKADDDLYERLKDQSEAYHSLSKDIARVESNDISNLDNISKDNYRDLKLQRDNIINNMASSMGPGPGLKSLMDLDYLINESKSNSISLMDYETRFLNGKKLNDSAEFQQLNNKLANTRQDYNAIDSRESITGDSVNLMNLARYQTARNISNMVTSYHMNNSLDQGILLNKSFAADHKRKLAMQFGYNINQTQFGDNRFKDGIPSQAQDEITNYLQSKYQQSNNTSGKDYDPYFDQKLALTKHLDLDYDSAFNKDGSMSSVYKEALETVAKDKLGGIEAYLLQFDSLYETAREQIDPLFGKDGERMQSFGLTELMRKNMANAQETGKDMGIAAKQNIRNMAGSEVLTTMAQLASSQKLGAQGMGVFSAMYRGVLSELINANKEILDVDGKNFSTADPVEQDYILRKTVYKNLVGTQIIEGQGWTRSTSEQTRDWKSHNARMVDEAEERYVYMEGDKSLTKVKSSKDYKGNGKLIRIENDVLDAFTEMNERSLTGQQAAAQEMMGKEILYEYAMNDGEFDRLVSDFMPGDYKVSSENVQYMKDNIQAQAARRQHQVIKQQKLAREMYMSMNDVTKRGSILNKVGDASLRALSKNKVSTGLDIILPFLLTGVGGMIQEGNIDDNQIQALGGSMFTAFQYARAGSIDDPNPAALKRKMSTAKAMTGTFKFKNALARYGDENIGAAVAEMALQETVSTVFNAATPSLNKFIETNVLGMKAHPSLSAMNMDKYAAGKQLAGNIGASVISAVSSTLITGVMMKTGVKLANGGMKDILDSFAPVANLNANVAERISRQRNQQQAYEEMSAETDGTEAEISSYWVMTDSSYNPNNYAHLADLQEAQEVDPSMDGTIYTDVLV